MNRFDRGWLGLMLILAVSLAAFVAFWRVMT